MKKRLLILVLTISVLTLCIFTQGTFAWFTDAAAYQKTFQIGDIKYIYSGGLITSGENEIVVPGQPLISGSSLSLTNQSSIDTNLRLQIRFSYEDQLTHETVNEIYSGGAGSAMDEFMEVLLVAGWEYRSADQCWHFKHNSSFVIPAATTIDGDIFSIIDSIAFNGDLVDMSLSGAIFNIKLIFQAKQAELVDWETIGMGEINNLVAG